MTTKDAALKQALDALEYSKSYLDELADVHGTSKKAKPGSTSWNVNRAITACREALARKDEQALHAVAAVPSEAISLSGDAKLAHDQCRAVAHLANSFAEVYAARAAIVAHDAKLSDLIGDASASAMEWLGDELNAMDAATEDDGWLDPIFEAAQKRWPQQPPRRPQKDEHEPVAEITADDMGRPFNAIRIGAHFYKEIPPVGTKLYTAPPECRLLTEKEICDAWLYATGYDIENGDSTESRTVHISPDEILEFARIVEGSLGVDHDAQP